MARAHRAYLKAIEDQLPKDRREAMGETASASCRAGLSLTRDHVETLRCLLIHMRENAKQNGGYCLDRECLCGRYKADRHLGVVCAYCGFEVKENYRVLVDKYMQASSDLAAVNQRLADAERKLAEIAKVVTPTAEAASVGK